MLIGMDGILEILETAICTSLVKNSIPTSVILIGPSGAGKSQALLVYDSVKIPTVHRSDDLTSRGIDDIVLGDAKNEIAHVLCPDFNIVLSHKDSVVNLTSAKLMGLMSDGIVRVDDGRSVKEVHHRQMGLLTAMTSQVYIHVSKKWSMLGFKRRFIPIFFDYSAGTKANVQSKIRNGDPCIITIKKNPLPKKLEPVEVTIKSKDAFVIEQLSTQLAISLAFHPKREAKTGHIVPTPGEPFIEFSPHHILRNMAKAHAILRSRKIVIGKDVEFLAGMVDYCRYGTPVRI